MNKDAKQPNMSRRVVLVSVALIALLLTGAFAVLRPDSSSSTTSGTEASQTRAIKVDIVGGKLEGKNGTFEVRQDETVVLDISADAAEELHLHGYDKELELQPGQRQQLTFVADKAGSFEAELHGSGTTVFVLAVQPK